MPVWGNSWIQGKTAIENKTSTGSAKRMLVCSGLPTVEWGHIKPTVIDKIPSIVILSELTEYSFTTAYPLIILGYIGDIVPYLGMNF